MISDYFTLCKPKVVALMLVTSWIGMQLASTKFIPIQSFILGSMGISLAAASAAVVNHLIDRHIDAKMQRTASRPIASGRVSILNAIIFALSIGSIGIAILYFLVNPSAALLTFLTVIGYAVIYTVFLKRASPQNIVIGGIFGAMPPLLGWVAVTGDISANALLLVLIIFIWTPPHFWALAIYRCDEYKNAGIPMLPVTHGIKFTKISIILYTILLLPCTILPYLTNMSGLIYLSFAIILWALFMYYAVRLYFDNNTRTAFLLFKFSIQYLLILFVVLLLDYFLKVYL